MNSIYHQTILEHAFRYRYLRAKMGSEKELKARIVGNITVKARVLIVHLHIHRFNYTQKRQRKLQAQMNGNV